MIIMDITDFLNARIAEDEATIQRAPKRADAFDISMVPVTGALRSRLLAECAAKRAIIALFKAEDVKEDWSVEASYAAGAEDCIFALAAVYKDHPDWRQQWAT